MSENTSRRDELHDVGAAEAKEPSGGTKSPCIDSRQLFGDRDEIAIQHGDQVYRLKITRYGRLILNK